MSASVLAWRQTCLDRQLPHPSFPAGIAVPAAVGAGALALLAVVGAGLLHRAGTSDPNAAVAASQEALLADVARGLDAAVRREVDALAAATADAAAPAAVAAARGSGWAGAAVWRPATRRTEAAAGRAVPQDPGAADRRVAAGRDGVVAHLPLPGGRVLTAVRPLPTRPLDLAPETGQTVVVTDATGTPVQTRGPVVPEREPWAGLLRAAVADQRAAAAPATRAGTGAHTPFGTRTPLVTVAPIGETGDHVASLLQVPAARRVALPAAWWVAAGGLGVAALVWLLLYGGLIRPLRDLLAVLRARACGAAAPSRSAARLAEGARILRVVGSLHARGRGLPAAVVVALAAGCALAGAAVLLRAYARQPDTVSQQLLADVRNRATGAQFALRENLVRGREALARTAAAWPADNRGGPLLDRLRAAEPGLRSAYLTEPDGRRSLTSGAEPYRPAGLDNPRDGVRLDPRVGNRPALYAQVQLPSGRFLAAEYDVRRLIDHLGRADGRIRVVDDRQRTILDTDGYIAFTALDGAAPRAAAAAADRGAEQPTRITRDGRVLTATAWRDPRLPDLRWAAVAVAPVSALRLPATEARRAARMVAAAVAAVATGLLLWQLFVIVLPLRRLRAAAVRLADGDTRTPITPPRFDEIGALAVCLEVWRQATVDGDPRLGGSPRLRPDGPDITVVLPTVAPRHAALTGRGHR
ncbi:hypothetical protein GCM10010123_05780 [Pilimelia anulata]|uniref:HAMP domain-containing protein n=1 Tax=Pilimelia anulata TaxID=53371 RepID=A0A8J3F7H7_9ACTN|nr:HAMP domain-containing protein [Pilimelia anulata]GGJ78672.1 hypothetical protein GCM10010123_05780 [Pilimelia anulata]